MKASRLLLLAVLTSILLLAHKQSNILNAQEPPSTSEPLPTLSRDTPFWNVFPVNLSCYDIDSPSEGLTWGDITIGISSADDLKNYVETIGNYDSIYQWADYISFSRTGSLRDKSGPPPLIEACLDIPSQTVTALKVSNNRPLYVEDLVAQYGVPDMVTWGSSNISRTVFWLEEGIATLVYILEASEIIDFGEIGLVVYFPYQTNEAFEEHWPYNRTNAENPIGGDHIYDPLPSEEQNPFDFEAMVATITLQPSRTSTPTFAPPLATLTATP